MEEHVGQIWHRIITRAVATGYPQATVELEDVSKTVGVLFRALGGDGGLRIEATTAAAHGARRNWLQRIAGTHKQVELCWRDGEVLRLPAQINLFPEKAINRDLYLWLAALAAGKVDDTLPWFQLNQQLTKKTLLNFPGLQSRYQRLVESLLTLRPDLTRLPPDEAAAERAIQQALRHPGTVGEFPQAKRPHQPVFLWLHPSPPINTSNLVVPDDESITQQPSKKNQTVEDKRRRRGERTEMPDGKKGLLAFRLESLFTLADYVKVDRCTDEEEESDAAKNALDDMDTVSVARDNKAAATSLRFDLDLPAPDYDDTPLGEGILLPEWDYKRQQLRPDYCCLQTMQATSAMPVELPSHLKRVAHRLRRQFEALTPKRVWHKGQQEGSEIDLDAYLLHVAERGRVNAERGLYRDFRGGGRDLACLLLADLSLSTDAWFNNKARVIEVIRDSLFLFAESLNATGDPFAITGFSSRHRSHVRFHTIKTFKQSYNAAVRGRILMIKPGYYTRMGAAIRHASTLLSQQKVSQPLLLLLTDGKPNDLDQYEGRYGVEDTRMALHEARKLGLQPFCVTIDEKASDYLPHIFGSNNYVVIRNPSDLPRELPRLYARLTH